MEIKIDKDIPIPGITRFRSKNFIEDLKQLEVGDSYLVENPHDLSIQQLRNRTNSRLVYFGKILNYGFTVRNTEEGLRVWRVK